MRKTLICMLATLCFATWVNAQIVVNSGVSTRNGRSVSWSVTKQTEAQTKDYVLTVSCPEGKSSAQIPSYGTDAATLPPWAAYKTTISSLVISNGITSVGSNAFRDMSGMKSVVFPAAGLVELANNCFYASGLTEVDVPATITTYGSEIFRACPNLTSVTLPSSLTSIPARMMAGCPNLTSVTIPSGVTEIGDVAFMESGLTSITLPEGLTKIGARAFEKNKFTSINIPASVTSIGETAPNSSWGTFTRANPFRGIANLTITVAEGNKKFKVIDNVLYELDANDIPVYLIASPKQNNPEGGKFTVPDGVMNICYSAFWDNDNLVEVVIPSSVKMIETEAFAYCDNLKTLSLGASFTKICDAAFLSCPKLEVDVDGENQNYTDADGVVFSKDRKTLVLYPASNTAKTYQIPDHVTQIGAYAFSGANNLLSVDFSLVKNTLTAIDRNAFYKAIKITSLDIPQSVSNIGQSAFSDMKALQSITLPSNLQSIETSIFSGCSALKSIDIPTTVKKIGGSAFGNCISLKSIDIPAHVTNIGDGAFSGCTGIKTAVIPAGVAVISKNLFKGCTSLESVRIESTAAVCSINDEAFKSCSKLMAVYINRVTPPSVSTTAFTGLNAGAKLLVPCDCADAYKNNSALLTAFGAEDIESTLFNKLVVKSADESMGSVNVTRQPSCGVDAIIEAVAETGYIFTGWSDELSNPQRQVTVSDKDIELTAYFEQELYMVTNATAAGSKGSVSLSKTSGFYNDAVEVTVTPDLGYVVDVLSVVDDNNKAVAVVDNSFAMPASNVTVTVTFKKAIYSINIASVENGSVVASKSSGNYRDQIALSVTPASGYQLASLSVVDAEGRAVACSSDNKFYMPASAVSVTAQFATINYSVAVGNSFVVGDLKYTVVSLEPNVVSVGAADDGLSGSVEIPETVEYLKVGYTVSSITAEGFKYNTGISSLVINRDQPMALGAEAINSEITVKVPCGTKAAYVSAGYTKIDNISAYAYAVSVETDGNGTASVLKQPDCDDHSAEVTAVASPGYQFKKWSNGATTATATIASVVSNVSVKAMFEAVPFNVYKTAATNGTFELSASTAIVGDVVAVAPTAANGYSVGAITVTDSKSNAVAVSAARTFVMPASDVNVAVAFTPIDYTVSLMAATNGVVTVDKATANVGQSVSIVATPNVGFRLETLVVKDADGQAVAVSGGVFTMPAKSVTVSATFAALSYNVNVATATDGTVAASVATAKKGAKVNLTLTPVDARYSVGSLSVVDDKGMAVAVASDNSFVMPASDVTVSATFVKTADLYVGQEFEVGNLKYRILTLDPASVSVSAATSGLSGVVELQSSVTYMNTTFAVTRIADNGFNACSGVTTFVSMINVPLVLGDKAFPAGKTAIIQIPCDSKLAYTHANYLDYFADESIVPYYDGYTLSVSTADANLGTVEVVRQAGCSIQPIVKATPVKGCRFVGWSDGCALAEYTYSSDLTSDLTLRATFEKIKYDITATVVPLDAKGTLGGLVTVDASSTYNEMVAVVATPNAGYELASVAVVDANGVAVAVNDGQFVMPDASVAVSVVFAPIEYAVVVVDVDGGTVNVGASLAHVSDRVAVSAVASEGYLISEALKVVDAEGNEVSIFNGAFTMPASNVTVTVAFEEDPSYVKDPEIPTAVSERLSSVVVYGTAGLVVVKADERVDITVYNVAGQAVYANEAVEGTLGIPMRQGIYVVRIGDVSTKVVVR